MPDPTGSSEDPSTPAPAPGWRDRTTVVDGNVLSGVLGDLFAHDASLLVAVCGACGASGALAETVVEVDDDAFLVRCRACTHTLFTVQRMPVGAVLRIEHLDALQASPA